MSETPSFESSQGELAKQHYQTRRIADILHAVTEAVEDEHFGMGVVFTPWDADDITFEWYPSAEVVRVQTSTMKLMLRRLGEPLLGQEQVIFSREDGQDPLQHFTLTRKGEITVLHVPLDNHSAKE